jgi:glucose-1-phosphate cytidylyltransferase
MTVATSDSAWAVVLCGGRGSRMGDATNELPKPLIEVHGKPILWYVIHSLYKNGVRDFVLPLGYRGEMIDSYARSLSRELGFRAHCVSTGTDTPIAQRVTQVSPLLADHSDFLLLNSDTIFDFDIRGMLAIHRAAKALVTLASVEVVSSWGLILMQDGKLVGFDRQRKIRAVLSGTALSTEGRVNSGIAWLNKDALDLVDLQTCSDFETAVYSRAIELGRAAHFHLDGVWFPIDTPKDLAVVNLMSDDRHGSGHIAMAVKEELTARHSDSSRESEPQN